jgi:acyl-CoA synthetase (AMP-forming)/AMP-acid ligase II
MRLPDLIHRSTAYSGEDYKQLQPDFPAMPPGVVAIHVPDGPLLIAALGLLRERQCKIAILHDDWSRDAALARAAAVGAQVLLTVEDGRLSWIALSAASSTPPSEVTLFTSGSTGEPKAAGHSWDNLMASVVQREEFQGARWLSLFPLSRFAGLNTLLHAWTNHATLILPERYDPAAIAATLRATQPTHASGTPTLWKAVLLHLGNEPDIQSLRQISLGGEVADSLVLRLLRLRFPHARVSHLYATTELGVCFAVSDGEPGFPARWLSDPGRGVPLRVVRGELQVCPAPGDRWHATGDLVEVRGERAHFLGRMTEVLNIGGAKVSPIDVEACLTAVEGVRAARVFGRKSSLAGYLVAAEATLEPGVDPVEARERILRHARATLAPYAVPRFLHFVDAVKVSSSGKLVRS